MDGLAPLSYPTVKAWAELMEIDVTPLEVRALMLLDSVIRKPDEDPEPKEPEEETPWPT